MTAGQSVPDPLDITCITGTSGQFILPRGALSLRCRPKTLVLMLAFSGSMIKKQRTSGSVDLHLCLAQVHQLVFELRDPELKLGYVRAGAHRHLLMQLLNLRLYFGDTRQPLFTSHLLLVRHCRPLV
jgi:hypothetical protein